MEAIGSGAGLSVTSGNLQNFGTIRVSNGATLYWAGGNGLAHGGIAEVGANSIVKVGNYNFLTLSQLQNPGLTISDSAYFDIRGVLDLDGGELDVATLPGIARLEGENALLRDVRLVNGAQLGVATRDEVYQFSYGIPTLQNVYLAGANGTSGFNAAGSFGVRIRQTFDYDPGTVIYGGERLHFSQGTVLSSTINVGGELSLTKPLTIYASSIDTDWGGRLTLGANVTIGNDPRFGILFAQDNAPPNSVYDDKYFYVYSNLNAIGGVSYGGGNVSGSRIEWGNGNGFINAYTFGTNTIDGTGTPAYSTVMRFYRGLWSNSGTTTVRNGAWIDAGSISISNSGLLDIGVGTEIRGYGNSTFGQFGQSANNARTIVNGTLDVGSISLSTGTLEGTGSIRVAGNGALNNNSATVSPGGNNAIGLLTLNGTYVQRYSTTQREPVFFGTLRVELSGASPESFDRFITTGATLDGELEIWTLNGFMPTQGQTFRFLTTGSGTRTGTFRQIESADPTQSWSVIYGTNFADLQFNGIVVVPEPTSGLLVTGGAMGLLIRRRKREKVSRSN
jgi:hypothetical protein